MGFLFLPLPFFRFPYPVSYTHLVMSGKRYLHLRIREGFKPDFEELAHIFRIGFPAMIEQFVMRAGMITYSKTVASLGTVLFATHQVCINIQSLSFMTCLLYTSHFFDCERFFKISVSFASTGILFSSSYIE